MATFPKEPNRIPTSIGPITMVLRDKGDIPLGGTYTYEIAVTVFDQNGQVMHEVSGELSQFMTANQLSAIQNFQASMRTKAAELLP